MYKKQRAEKLLEIYNNARGSNLSGAEAGVHYLHSENKFYFTDAGMEYSIRVNDVAGNLEGAGYDQVNKIRDWAQTKYE